jgi:roadblock/LC7 domain-containing protein
LIVGQRGVINDQQAVESRTELTHHTSEMGTSMCATLHRATDTQSNGWAMLEGAGSIDLGDP